jgi:hypothetical protein
MILQELFRKYRVVGLVGNSGESKTSLGLSELIELKEKNPKVSVYVLGVEPSLFPFLIKKGIQILESKEDILDLKISNSVLFVDEFGDIFRTETANREMDKIKRFFNRIDHLNDFVLISSARENFYNKLMDGLVKAHLVKKVEYQSLCNGTTIKRKILSIVENTSDYRLDIPKDTFYVVTDDDIVKKMTFKYNPDLDSKKENINPFLEKNEKSNAKK